MCAVGLGKHADFLEVNKPVVVAVGWKVYDLNVEGIWLIQNYRNQFASEINRSGIDGLIAALNTKK